MSLNVLKRLVFLKNQSCSKVLKIETEEQIVAEKQILQSFFVISVFIPGAHSASKSPDLQTVREGRPYLYFDYAMWKMWQL